MKQKDISTLKEAAVTLLESFENAHKKIINGQTNIWDAGTTTLLGGLLFELDEPQLNHSCIFLCVNVGDCKIFHWSAKSENITDITAGNRRNLTDAKDPGGRIGPFLAPGLPDWRNLGLYFTECDIDDIIVAVSDGVHDNLDPQELGYLPKELGLNEFNSWDEAEQGNPHETDRIKTEYRTNFLKKLFLQIMDDKKVKKLEVNEVTKKLLEHCQEVTKKSRVFMEQNPGKRLPSDYLLFPGKLDHSTCLAFKVNKIRISDANNTDSRNSRK